MRPVAIPISAPNPNSPPSANWVEALCRTIAEIDLLQEPLRRGLVLGHDAVGVVGAVSLDMVDRRVETVDDADRDDRVEIFRAPVLFARRRHPRIGLTRRRIAAHGAAGLDQRVDQLPQQERGDRAMHEQGFGCAADPGSPHLGVDDDPQRLVEIHGTIDVDMHDAFEMGEHRHPRLTLNALDQALSSARHDHVERAVEALKHLAHRLAGGEGRACNRSLRQTSFLQARDQAGVDRG